MTKLHTALNLTGYYAAQTARLPLDAYRLQDITWGLAIRAALEVILAAAAACYVAGYELGAWIHRLNDRLAALVTGRTEEEEEVDDPRDTIAAEVHFPEPDLGPATLRGMYDTCTVKELRHYARGMAPNVHLMRKAQLLDLLTQPMTA